MFSSGTKFFLLRVAHKWEGFIAVFFFFSCVLHHCQQSFSHIVNICLIVCLDVTGSSVLTQMREANISQSEFLPLKMYVIRTGVFRRNRNRKEQISQWRPTIWLGPVLYIGKVYSIQILWKAKTLMRLCMAAQPDPALCLCLHILQRYIFTLHTLNVSLWITTTDKKGSHIIYFLFLHKNLCCGYSLEAPQQGASNEYPQHTFSWRNKKNISTAEKSALYGAMWIHYHDKLSYSAHFQQN